jgi:hypothetical protein
MKDGSSAASVVVLETALDLCLKIETCLREEEKELEKQKISLKDEPKCRTLNQALEALILNPELAV